MATKTRFPVGKANPTTERIEPLDMKDINRLMDEQIKILDRKLVCFKREFQAQFAGYTPDFLADIIYAHKIKLPLN